MKNWQRTYDIRKNWWRLDGELIKTWWRAGEELVKSWWRTDELLLRPFFCVFGPRVGSGTQFWNNHMDPFFYSVEDQFTLWYRSGLVSPWKFFHRCKIEIFDPSWSINCQSSCCWNYRGKDIYFAVFGEGRQVQGAGQALHLRLQPSLPLCKACQDCLDQQAQAELA